MNKTIGTFLVICVSVCIAYGQYDYNPYNNVADFIYKRSVEELPEGYDPCSGEFPAILNMKRMLISQSGRPKGKRNPMALEFAKQVNDLERFLAFCNRRNNVSKLRLL